jgi:hypothetical protein
MNIKIRKNKFDRQPIAMPNLCMVCSNKDVSDGLTVTRHFSYPARGCLFGAFFGALGKLLLGFFRIFYHPRIRVKYMFCEEHYRQESAKLKKVRRKLTVISLCFLGGCLLGIFAILWPLFLGIDFSYNRHADLASLFQAAVIPGFITAIITLAFFIRFLIKRFNYNPGYIGINCELLGILSQFHHYTFSIYKPEIADEFKEMYKDITVETQESRSTSINTSDTTPLFKQKADETNVKVRCPRCGNVFYAKQVNECFTENKISCTRCNRSIPADQLEFV